MHPTPRLLVADQVAGSMRVLELPGGRETAAVEGRHLAEHAGFLALPGGRAAFVDDLAGELVVLDPYGPDHGRPLVTATVPVATPAEHLAADPSGRHLAVTTGLGRNPEAWSDLLTAVDLGGDGDRPRAVRVRTRPGEPGVTVLGGPGSRPLTVLRHREPGTLAAYRHDTLLSAAPACPPATPSYETALADDDGHGDAHDPVTGRLFAAAGSGVHRARREGDRLVPEEPLPWAGPGRGYYLRLDPVRRALWSCVRGGPPAPGAWPEWTNDAWFHGLDDGRTGRVPLGPGLVFRLAVSDRHITCARVHPDGDELILVDPSAAGGPRVAARFPLPPMDGAPKPGATPWDGVQRRAVAASPGGPLIAVTRGGHGEIHLFDGTGEAEPQATFTVPTSLDEGGHLALITPDDGAEADPVGR
ncbi:hypothetical protein I3F58_18725 [Streptomyces sp. MUM 203J]|uniref:hypothetical protein n=1 Tax=Streptomyces sp. MUM 203J TaxID=2791990 RepID=UPI001F045FAE|nr:hypothetical protein [Streptomyces sp. MUM 203J]MCH0541557.1 hypothetical protein [Streptomyces sp. MUM 203J]